MEDDTEQQIKRTWGLAFTKKAFKVMEDLDIRRNAGASLEPGQYPVRGDDVILKSKAGSRVIFRVKRLQYDFMDKSNSIIKPVLGLRKGFDYKTLK